MSELIVRSENKYDFEQIEDLLSAAFNGPDEAALVARIRRTPEYINQLTLVGCQKEKIVGFVMLSYISLNNKSASHRILALAPLAVLPPFQKKHIGSLLMEECIKAAEKLQEPLIVLLGHADYYPRFGFKRASKYGIHPPVPWSDESYMALPLAAMTRELKGTVSYPAAWQIG